MRSKALFPALSLALACGAAMASSDVRPLDFAAGSDAFRFELKIDAEHVRSLAVSEDVRHLGRRMAVTPVAVAFEAGVTRTIEISIDADRFRGLPDGLYTDVVRAEGAMPAESNVPVVASHLVHFRIAGGHVEPLSLKQYSAIAEPVFAQRFADGSHLPVQAGASVAEAPANRQHAAIDTTARLDVAAAPSPNAIVRAHQVADDKTRND